MKFYKCEDCNCKCTISAPKEKNVESLNFPCDGGNFKEITKKEYQNIVSGKNENN